MPISKAKFESYFSRLKQEVVEHATSQGFPAQAAEWTSKNLEYNTLGGKCNRGMSVVDSTSILKDRDLTEEELFKSATLGWMVELLQAFFLVSDDIMDNSVTRRGSRCWYRQPKVGMIAINDAFMLEMAIYILLKKHFRSEKCYIDLMELFQEVTFQTEMGQTCDLLTAPEDHVNLNNFSMEKYKFIVIYKTAYYSFYLPVALAMHFCDLASPENLKAAHDILIPMGEYFQVQDDYLDAFADPSVLGKVGTDIQDNKCSWLVNTALTVVTSEQRKLLDEIYGKKDAAAEQKVKELYHKLGLEQMYKDYEDKVVGELKNKIQALDESKGLKKEVFEAFLKKIYKRSK